MKRIIFSSVVLYGLALAACSKSSDSGSGSNESFTSVESDVITDFVNSTALPQYNNLVSTGTVLNASITALTTSPTDANLASAQTSWRQMRTAWERCEGFLI